jgi:hypothetical protein
MLGWIGMMSILVMIPLVVLRQNRRSAALCLSVITVFLINTMAFPHMYARLWAVPILIAIGLALKSNTPSNHTLGSSDDPELPTPPLENSPKVVKD